MLYEDFNIAFVLYEDFNIVFLYERYKLGIHFLEEQDKTELTDHGRISSFSQLMTNLSSSCSYQTAI